MPMFPSGVVVTVGLLLALAANAQAARSEGASSPAATRLGALLDAINKAPATGAVSHAAFGADGGMSPASAEALVTEMRERTGGLDVLNVVGTATEAVAQCRARLTEEPLALRVRVEPAPPHRVLAVERVRPESAPAETPPADDAALAAKIEQYFSGDTFKLVEGEKVLIRGTFSVDPSKTPKVMELVIAEGAGPDPEAKAHGIYELNGDELKWCVAEPGTDARPDKFETKGTTNVLIQLKRSASSNK